MNISDLFQNATFNKYLIIFFKIFVTLNLFLVAVMVVATAMEHYTVGLYCLQIFEAELMGVILGGMTAIIIAIWTE